MKNNDGWLYALEKEIPEVDEKTKEKLIPFIKNLVIKTRDDYYARGLQDGKNSK